MRARKNKSIYRYMFALELGKRFRYLAYVFVRFMHFFTLIFAQCGLIDRNHPYVREENLGKYHFREVLVLALSNIKWQRDNIPQILMAGAVLGAIILSFAMIGVTVAQLALVNVEQAYAQSDLTPPTSYVGVDSDGNTETVNIDPADDLVFNLLGNIFGDTGLNFFTTPTNPTWLHDALGSMLTLYSSMMLIIASFIILYYISSVLLETSREGVPFGQRFDTVWAPLRFVFALGLLFPIAGNGYNTAQLIVFQAAHWGGAFASNIWIDGISAYGSENVIGNPPVTQGAKAVRGYWLMANCMEAWNSYVKKENGTDTCNTDCMNIHIQTEKVKTPDGTGKSKFIIYKIGNKRNTDFCGAIRVPLIEDESRGSSGLVRNAGARVIQAGYQNVFCDLVGGYDQKLGRAKNNLKNVGKGKEGTLDKKLTSLNLADFKGRPKPNTESPHSDSITNAAKQFSAIFKPGTKKFNKVNTLDSPYFTTEREDVKKQLHYIWLRTYYKDYLENRVVDTAVEIQQAIATDIIKEGATRGWGQAGSYIMTLASMNGSVQNAMQEGISLIKEPDLMTNENALPESSSALGKLWTKLKDFFTSSDAETRRDAAKHTHNVLEQAEKWWLNTPPLVKGLAPEIDYSGSFKVASEGSQSSEEQMYAVDTGGNILTRKVSSILELDKIKGFFKIKNIHNPAATMVTLGAWLLGVGVYGLAVGAGLSAGFLGLGFLAMTFAGLLLSAGIALYIVLPIIPYLYFTFSVITWAVGIFEAVVAMPLWALSFLQIERGGGLFPQASKNGLWIIFQIFLRPALMIIAMIGALLVFSGAINFLNSTFSTVMDTVARGPIVFIGLIIVYAVLCYSIALTVFKMVDDVPNSIIDFLGIGSPSPLTDFPDEGKNANTLLAVVGAKQVSGAASGVAHTHVKKKRDKDERKTQGEWKEFHAARERQEREQGQADTMKGVSDVINQKFSEREAKDIMSAVEKRLGYQGSKGSSGGSDSDDNEGHNPPPKG